MISAEDYAFLAAFLRKRSGLALGPGKEYLVDGRLLPVARRIGLDTVSDLVRELRRHPQSELSEEVVEAMATSETSFFRDRTPFEELREKMLPEVIENKRHSRRLRIWSAACATGQEPYTISMILHESFPELAAWDVEILGTDLSKRALARAEEGTYSQFEAQRGLSIHQLLAHFEQRPNGWRVNEHLRRRISWRQLNLLRPFDGLGRFDVIFCRNVLIYLNVEEKANILDRLLKSLNPGGHLVLGAAESVLGLSAGWERHREYRSAVYRVAGHVDHATVR